MNLQLIQDVYAGPGVGTTVSSSLTTDFTDIGDLAGFVINIILGIGWALTFIMLAGGFIRYITSRGETKATDSARNWLTYAALGGVGLFFLTVIKNIILSLLTGNTSRPQEIDEQFDPFAN